MTDQQKAKLIVLCSRVFSPSAPVNKRELFAGRIEQIQKISEAIGARGRHAIMYGDRGVGKTSLANILRELFSDMDGAKILKTNCNETDDFLTVWQRACAEIPVLLESPVSTDDVARPEEYSLDQWIVTDKHVGPGEIRRLLEFGSRMSGELTIVFDEFDRLAVGERKLFADTIKDLSDNSVDATLVLVGVVRDVVDLIAEHGSIDRCVSQILMPPMARDELQSIITNALTALGMTIEPTAAKLILALSQGYPHYTHLLGQGSALIAIKTGRLAITASDVAGAIREALDRTQETVRDEYYKAAQGQRKKTLFPQVLLACALAQVDELGFFRSTDVRGPLRAVTNEDYDIPNYSQHLNQLSNDDTRGPVLEQRGSKRRYKFRFRNPLLRPFIIMKGLGDGVLSGTLLEQITDKSDDSLFDSA